MFFGSPSAGQESASDISHIFNTGMTASVSPSGMYCGLT